MLLGRYIFDPDRLSTRPNGDRSSGEFCLATVSMFACNTDMSYYVNHTAVSDAAPKKATRVPVSSLQIAV